MFCFEPSIKLRLAKGRFVPLVGLSTGCSFTRTATAEVISGSKAVIPKTNLRH
jgi:hypothetical protein